MSKKFQFNPRKCTSAKTLSGSIHHLLYNFFSNKCRAMEVFKQALIGGMSNVNTRLGFDTNVLIKNKDQKLI